ncbi:MAG: heavy-metal-associated domain-containing protein [Chlorobiaceae bacterium]|nr:heavy-metal-associated domain-containing protein [Chlorobiaceae bacterium]NTW63737.1 heavy-metal-associated domain-containing protein [Chlorobiaceae bacterium]
MKNEFHVVGMRCSNCELLVKEALEELDGVESASPSHQTGTVEVQYDPDKVSIAALQAVIEQQGFSVNE